MKSKLFLITGALLMLSGAFAFQACFYSEPGPGYYGSGPVVVGEYDDGHVWHDRYWWISNRHDWVHEHRPDWVSSETHEEHEAYEHHH